MDIYIPFSSLVNTIWWLSDDQYHRFVSKWRDPSSSISSSLCWYHPIHPCFWTCFTLVVLHSNQVMGDVATELLYDSIFKSAVHRQMCSPKVFAFKQSCSLFSQDLQPQAYRVYSSTEFIPIRYQSTDNTTSFSMCCNESWPVSTTDEHGRVLFFVSIDDVESMEREFETRRKSTMNGPECMFVHRCIHVKVATPDSREPTLTTLNQYDSPLQHSGMGLGIVFCNCRYHY